MKNTTRLLQQDKPSESSGTDTSIARVSYMDDGGDIVSHLDHFDELVLSMEA